MPRSLGKARQLGVDTGFNQRVDVKLNEPSVPSYADVTTTNETSLARAEVERVPALIEDAEEALVGAGGGRAGRRGRLFTAHDVEQAGVDAEELREARAELGAERAEGLAARGWKAGAAAMVASRRSRQGRPRTPRLANATPLS